MIKIISNKNTGSRVSADCKAINAFSLLQTFYTPTFNSNVNTAYSRITL